MNELEKVRRQGHAYDNEECEIGARCIAVPIYDYTQKTVACISVTGTIFRMTDEKLSENLDFLMDEARKLSVKLGYNMLPASYTSSANKTSSSVNSSNRPTST